MMALACRAVLLQTPVTVPVTASLTTMLIFACARQRSTWPTSSPEIPQPTPPLSTADGSSCHGGR